MTKILEKMKHKTITLSFLSGIAGAVVVLITLLVISNTGIDNAYNNQKTDINSQNEMPVYNNASYAPQQAIDLTHAATKSVDAVVHIKTKIITRTNSYDDFFGPFREYFYRHPQNNSYIAFGSGVIISNDGYIVTNNHVIDGADQIMITFNNEIETEATVVGVDPNTDLALVKVDESGLPFLNFGDSDNLQIGDWVLAVGNPFDLTSTVTAGIVSAKARNINILGGQSSIESFIQTDAVVNRGNSGGALVNTNGELVGINAAIASHTGVYEGYSFAIPVNIVKKVVNDLMHYGEVQRGYLGVQIQDIDAEFAHATGLESVNGIYVAGVVENSGAAEAGLKEGDIIISINGINTNSLSTLLGVVAQHSPGEEVTLEIKRSDNTEDVNVMLKNRNGDISIVEASDSFFNQELGAELQPVDQSELNKLHINGGLKVLNVNNGILSKSGITKGFVITIINGKIVKTQSDIENAMNNNRSNIIRLNGIYPNGVKVSFEFMR